MIISFWRFSTWFLWTSVMVAISPVAIVPALAILVIRRRAAARQRAAHVTYVAGLQEVIDSSPQARLLQTMVRSSRPAPRSGVAATHPAFDA